MSYEFPDRPGALRRSRNLRARQRTRRFYPEHWLILLIVGGTIARAAYLVFW